MQQSFGIFDAHQEKTQVHIAALKGDVEGVRAALRYIFPSDLIAEERTNPYDDKDKLCGYDC